jgi:hypothetical protein
MLCSFQETTTIPLAAMDGPGIRRKPHDVRQAVNIPRWKLQPASVAAVFDMPECMMAIFELLPSLAALSVVRLVCRSWNDLAGDWVLRRTVLSREITLRSAVRRQLLCTLTHANREIALCAKSTLMTSGRQDVDYIARVWYAREYSCSTAGCESVMGAQWGECGDCERRRCEQPYYDDGVGTFSDASDDWGF